MATNGTNGAEPKNRKLCIICSKGTLDMAYPPLILANAARMSGIDVDLFFTFWGLDIIKKKTMQHLKLATVGNPNLGMPTMVGGLPGMSTMATNMMKKKIDALDFPEVDEFIEILHDSGANIYACVSSMEMQGLTQDDIVDYAEILGAIEFMELAEGAQVLFI